MKEVKRKKENDEEKVEEFKREMGGIIKLMKKNKV